MNLAWIRKARGLSQAELADMVGLDQSTIQRAETQHQSAKLGTYKMCAEALGVSLVDIFGDERTSVEQVLLNGFRQLPKAQKSKILAILEIVASEDLSPDQEIDSVDNRLIR